MHKKPVGIFIGDVAGPSPCWCSIRDDGGGEIRFNHRNIADLEHLVAEMKKDALRKLGEHSNEV